MISTGKLKHVNDDHIQKITAEFLKDEIIEVTRLQQYGLSSNPPSGSLVLGIHNKNRDATFAVAVQDNKTRPITKSGDVTVYNGKSKVELQGGKVLINNVDIIKLVKDLCSYLEKAGKLPAVPGKPVFDPSLSVVFEKIKGELNVK